MTAEPNEVENSGEANGIENEKKKTIEPRVTLDCSEARITPSCYVAMWVWLGWMFFYFALFFVWPILLFFTPTFFLCLLVLIGISAAYPITRSKQPSWGYKLAHWAMHQGAKYFHLKVVLEDYDAVTSCGPAIFALEPHNVLPLSIFSLDEELGALPGHKCLSCITSAAFKVPIMRHFYTWANGVGVDKKGMTSLIQRGYSPVLIPGGVAEVTYLGRNEDECVLYLNSRLGFVKLAMKFGIPVVPVFTFGLDQSYDFFVPQARWMHRLGRIIGFLPMCIFGVFGVPFGPPKSSFYTTVVGQPIELPKNLHPTDDQVRAYHRKYIRALEDIYEKYKDEYGMGHIRLKIV